MPREEDLLFLRAAAEAGVLDKGLADEVLAALEKIEQLGATSSAREVAVNRGFLTPAQADQVLATSNLKEPAQGRRPGRIGNFEILEKLGVGGMGVVYKARQVSMDRLVALKILPPRLARDRSFVARFLREARSAARLNHPNIVQGIDVGEADGLYYFAMELVDGETLRQKIERVGRLPQLEALQAARQVALALEHANSHHITHRDIKPDNILLTRKGVAKLADLGLAKRATDVSVTQLNSPLGTPLYMSPEQARGEASIDTRSDIYSLGATLYHAAVGSPPFTGPNSTAVITQHLFEKPPWPRDAVPELTEGFCCVLTKMLAKKPQERYQSPTEVLEDINRLLNGRPPARAASARTPSTAVSRARSRRRRSPLVPIFATTLIFVLAGGAWLLYTTLASATEEAATRRVVPSPEPRPLYTDEAIRRAAQKQAQAPPPEGAMGAADAATAELERVRKWAKENRKDPQAAISRFQAVAARFPRTVVARAAQREIEALEEDRKAQARSAVNEACHEAKRLAGQHKYAAAVELLDRFAEEHRDYLDEVSEERGFILADANKTERELREQARQLAAKGDFAGAIALHKQLLDFGIPKVSALAKREISLFEEQAAAAQGKSREEAEGAYLALRLKIAPLLEARQYAQARELLEGAMEDAKMAPVRGGLEGDARDLAAVASLWAAADRGAQALKPNQEFSVGGIRGAFERFGGGLITVRASGLECSKALNELTASEVLTLARSQMEPEDPQTHFSCGLFLLAEGKAKPAAKAFTDGEKAGGDAKRFAALIERRQADIIESEADALLAHIEEATAASKWKQVAEALRAYEGQYGRTRSFGRSGARREELAVQSRLATLEVSDLFHGKSHSAGNGHRVELAYDFSEAEQLADWDLRGPEWTLEPGRLVLRGSRAVFRAPVERDLQAALQLADASGPPGEWGLFLAELPEAPPLYTIALPERLGLKVALLRKQQEVAFGQTPFRVNQPRKLGLVMKSRRIALTADSREVFSWSPEGGSEAAPLRLGISSKHERAVEVNNVRLTVTVAKEWAADELERLRVRLHKQHELAKKPWRSLSNQTGLDPWRAEHGAWEVAEGVATTKLGGDLVLNEPEFDDFELRLKAQPLKENSVVRLSFRLARNGERYGLVLTRRARESALVLLKQGGTQSGEELARFAEKVEWKPGQWYDIRVVAVESELRAELGGATLCVVRDDRRHRGTLSLDVPHGGAAFKDIALRALE